jgi:hypothetical protein
MSTLTKEDKRTLRSEGWLFSEIRQLNSATTPSGKEQPRIDINSKVWLAIRRSRVRYVADLKRNGWTNDEIIMKISNYYKSGKTDAFSWLKAEYHPARKIQDFQAAIERKIQKRAWKRGISSVDHQRVTARANITKKMGYIYGRNLKRATVRRRMPVRPVIRRVIRRKVQNAS